MLEATLADIRAGELDPNSAVLLMACGRQGDMAFHSAGLMAEEAYFLLAKGMRFIEDAEAEG
jgi:hypothetical protein